MNVKWLIEKNIFETEDEMISIINDLGLDYYLFDYIPIIQEIEKIPFSEDDCVIFYGSLNAAAVINRKFNFKPGIYGNFDNYKCTSYYQYFEDSLLNKNRVIVPYNELKLIHKELLKIFSIDNMVFIRPDSGLKPFTGKAIDINDFEEECNKEFELYGDLKYNDLILISKPKTIISETRFVIIGDDIISGSTYRDDGKYLPSDYVDPDAVKRLEDILEDTYWRPDNVWVADVCKINDDTYHLLEIGSFSCSGLYKNNLKDVVKNVSEEVLRQWKSM